MGKRIEQRRKKGGGWSRSETDLNWYMSRYCANPIDGIVWGLVLICTRNADVVVLGKFESAIVPKRPYNVLLHLRKTLTVQFFVHQERITGILTLSSDIMHDYCMTTSFNTSIFHQEEYQGYQGMRKHVCKVLPLTIQFVLLLENCQTTQHVTTQHVRCHVLG
jgi:hypothetical protein